MAQDQEIKRLSDGWLALIIGVSWLGLTWLSGERIFIKGNTEFGVVAIFITTILGFILFSAIGVYLIRSDRDAGRPSVSPVSPSNENGAKECRAENKDSQ